MCKEWRSSYQRYGFRLRHLLPIKDCLSVSGKTIAIVASGLDITHPKENKPLQDRILQNEGLLLSEQVIGLKAKSPHD